MSSRVARFGGIAAAVLCAATDSGAESWLRTYDDIPVLAVEPFGSGGFATAFTDISDPDNISGVLAVLDAVGTVTWGTEFRAGSNESIAVTALGRGGGPIAYAYGWAMTDTSYGPGTTLKRFDAFVFPESYLWVTSVVAADGGQYAAGRTWAQGRNVWLARLDSAADLVWQKALGQDDPIQEALVRVAGGGVVLAIGTRSRDSWLGHYLADGTPAWSRRLTAAGRWLQLDDLESTSDGGFVVAGSVRDASTCCAGQALLLKVNGAGDPIWARELETAARQERFLEVREIAGQDLLVRGESAGTSMVIRFDAAGSLLWQRSYPQVAIRTACQEASGGLYIAGKTGSLTPSGLGFLARLEDDGSMGSCIASPDPGLRDAPAGGVQLLPDAIAEDVGRATPGAMFGGGHSYGGASLQTLCATDCVGTPATVQALMGARSGLDALWRWDPDPAAAAYDLWYVGDKRDLDRARLDQSPPASAVPGCAWPAPVAGTQCSFPGSIPLAPDLHFYQVRSFCSAGHEGP